MTPIATTGPQGDVGPAGPPVNPASDPEVILGTDEAKAVTPAGLAAAFPHVDVRTDHGAGGAVGDGVANDLAAVRANLAAASGTTLEFPAGTFLLHNVAATNFFSSPAESTTIRGQGPDKTILVVTAGTTDQRSIFAVGANNIAFEGLTIRRASDFPALMFALADGAEDVSFTNCVFDGGEDLYTSEFTHGIYVPESGTVRGVRAENCTWQNFDYPWLQNNTSTAEVEDVRFINCKILDWIHGGLSFNAPIGVNKDVVLERCRFIAADGRIAAAFAHVEGGSVTKCYFSCAGEAVHVEDYSTAIRIESNEMDSCAETLTSPSASGVVTVIDSHNVVVTGNTIRNPNAVAHTSKALITVVGVPSGTTVGGRAKLNATYDVRVTNNTVEAGPNLAIQRADCASIEISGNTLVGGLIVDPSTFAETGTNIYAGILAPKSTKVSEVIRGNSIRGFLYGITPSISTPFSSGTFQHGTVVAQNVINSCRYGIIGNNCRPSTFTGNTIYGCVHPLTVGATGNGGDGGGNFSYAVSGNTMYGNQRRASIAGGMVITSAGTATVGSGVTLTVQPLIFDLSGGGGGGKAITFSGGGVLTTTSSRPSASTTVTGNLTVANIASGEVGWVTGFVDRANEAPFTVNNRAIATNADSVANTYT